MSDIRTVRRLYREAERLSLKLVEGKARRVLRKNPHLKEFVMAMGTWLFVHRDGGVVVDTPYCARGLAKLINELDDTYHLTGHPMRFTADGPVVTDW